VPVALAGSLGAVAASGLALALCARMQRPWLPLLGVALVPWLAALERHRTTRATVLSAIAMSGALVAAVFWWFPLAVATYTGMPAALAWLLLLALAPILEPQLAAFALVRRSLRRGSRPWLAPPGAAAAYVAAEWALPKLFADTLGHGIYPSPVLRQAADVAGVSGLTLAVLFVNEAALAATVHLRGHGTLARRLARALGPVAGIVVLVAALSLYGRGRLDDVEPGAAPVRLALVQSGIGQYARLASELGTYEATRRILDVYLALSRDALARTPRVDAVIWPETAYPTTFGSPKSPEGAAFDREIAGFVAIERVPLVFGAYDAEGGREFNAAIVLEPEDDGVSFGVYRKVALFPLIEHVPGWLDRALVRRALPWLGGWTPGEGAEVLGIRLASGRRLRVGPLICYDAVEPALARAAVRQGAELLLTLSNDSWFDAGAGPRLHLVLAAFRSIETRRAQVRATNTGISAVIDHTGALVATVGVGERRVLEATVVPAARAPGLAQRWGDWLGPAAAGVALALLGLATVTRRSRGRGGSPRPGATEPRRRPPARAPRASPV
jgi:apolipoprotein N-acyltransferase